MLKRVSTAAILAAVMVTAAAAGNHNPPPKAEDIAITTAEGIKAQGNAPVYDADGEAVRATVIAYPQKGELKFSGTQFTYTPFKGESGKDSFKYVFTDAAGNSGNTATAKITIEPTAQISYADMKGNPSHFSAVKLNEHKVVSGEQIGGKLYFYPERQVTRAEYLLMLLSALGEEVQPCVNTGLKNDGEIPAYLKPAVKRASELEIVTGKLFKCSETITRAEAVVMADRAAGIENVRDCSLKISDRGRIPGYAVQAYMNLSSYRMLDLYDGKARPNRVLTKGAAADLVWQVYKLKMSRENK